MGRQGRGQHVVSMWSACGQHVPCCGEPVEHLAEVQRPLQLVVVVPCTHRDPYDNTWVAVNMVLFGGRARGAHMWRT